MKHIPLLLKHFIVLMSIMLISMAILVWYSATRIMKYSELEIAESSLAETKANRELTDEVMTNIVENSVRLASSNIFDSIRDIRSLTDLNNHYSQITTALSIQSQLSGLNKMNSGIYSSFFYFDQSDYVISTDKGITSLRNYELLNWLSIALEKREGIKGVWISRWDYAAQKSMISYVLPLNTLNTATRGTLVINIRESEFKQYLSSEQAGFHEYILINENGFIISHADQAMLYSNIGRESFYKQLLTDPRSEGYSYIEEKGKRQLVTWSRSGLTGWLNVNKYESELQMNFTYSLQKSIYILAIIMISIGFLLAIFVTKRLSVPINKLVRMVNTRMEHSSRFKNELLLLEDAFERMQEEEKELHRLLSERESDAAGILLQQIIRGEITELAYKHFKKRHFIVSILSIDGYRKYSIKNSKESRSFHRYKLIADMKDTDPFNTEYTVHTCMYQGDGCYIILFNCDQAAPILDQDQLSMALSKLQSKAGEIFQQTVTISTSNYTSSIHEVHTQYRMANEGMKQRILQGNGKIYFYSGEWDQEVRHYYPVASEKRILSYLDQCDFEKMKEEIRQIRTELSQREDLSPDNVLFVSHQLVGATIKHMRENNVNVQRLFSTNKNIYTYLAMSETLEDVEDALVGFYEDITSYLLESNEGNQHGEKIVQYLRSQFREDIVFEEMAKEIGISYSYMRKIIFDMTGNSLIDYVHMLRIEQAKKLLRETSLTIGQIAEDVGYNNIRSFNRFFQKVESITPSAFRSEKTKGITNVNGKVIIEQ